MKKTCIFSIIILCLLFSVGIVSGVLPTISNEYPSDNATLWDCPSATINVTITNISAFNWSIETSPDVGSSSDTTDTNGSKTCAVSGLLYSTTYRWYVNTTNATTLLTNVSYNFTTRDAKLRENPALNTVEKGLVVIMGIIIIIGILFVFMKTADKKDTPIVSMLMGILIAIIFIGVIFSVL